jgi:hypothetical protein
VPAERFPKVTRSLFPVPYRRVPKLIQKKNIKGEYMKIKNMRSVLFLLLTCLVITLPFAAAANIELSSVGCTDDAYAGVPGGTGIGVVDVSGHGNTFIDGAQVAPAGTGTYKGYATNYYGTSEGDHTVLISSDGYYAFTFKMHVCSGKMSYVYYDQASHLYAGLTGTATSTTVPVTTPTDVLTSTTYAGPSVDYRAVMRALGTPTQSVNLGALSIATDPTGATVFIDGAQAGISPVTITGIDTGSHTVLLKLDEYQDLTLPVVISAGRTQYYSSALQKVTAAPEVTAGAITTQKSSAPGFAAAVFACVVGVLFFFRKTRP